MRCDFLVVGAGLTGCTIARLLRDAGFSVLIVDRRSHVAGNVHDFTHASGIRVHTYGPHYFRTDSESVWRFVNRFASFYPYCAEVKVSLGGELINWPVSRAQVEKMAGPNWRSRLRRTNQSTNLEEAALTMMPREVYDPIVKEYNEKQWGIAAQGLSASLCTRFDVREDGDPRLKPTVRHQGLPEQGYTAMVERMIGEIPVLLNFTYSLTQREIQVQCGCVYTGPIDELFGYDLGRLAYRAQRRLHQWVKDRSWCQKAAQVNFPCHKDGPQVRTIEWEWLMPLGDAERLQGTVLTSEIPFTPTDPVQLEYPFPNAANQSLYAAYARRAAELPNLFVAGRLGRYRYLDMDVAISEAMDLAGRLLEPHALPLAV